MSINDFSLPGSGQLNPFKDSAISRKGIFAKPKYGGGAARAGKPASAPAESGEELIPEPVKAPAAEEKRVKLSNPRFLVEEGSFEEKVPFTVDADLPAELKDITRVIVTVFAISPEGKKQQVHARDYHITDGKVTGELELRRPPRKDGKEVESCPYSFTAKHRDSKEVESPRIQVTDKRIGNEDLVLELSGSKETKAEGYTFELKSKDGSFSSRISSQDAEEKDGKIIMKFTKLKSDLNYSLEILDAEGEYLETVFKDATFGKWDGKSA